jgi:D-ribose pyranose/furanose isomerase RbsD
MQIQLYLSAEVQSHFAISPQNIQSDNAIVLSSNWKALWRCDHLISTDDGLEHLFLFTNAVSKYSLILIDRSNDLASLLGSFQQHFLLALHEHGSPFPTNEEEVDFDLLSGVPLPLTQHMSLLGDLAIEHLIANDADIEAAEVRLNSYESISQPTSASKAVRQRLQPAQATNAGQTIVPFVSQVAAR